MFRSSEQIVFAVMRLHSFASVTVQSIKGFTGEAK